MTNFTNYLLDKILVMGLCELRLSPDRNPKPCLRPAYARRINPKTILHLDGNAHAKPRVDRIGKPQPEQKATATLESHTNARKIEANS